jgi:hypothetical protein
MNGIIQNNKSFIRADYDNLPKCLIFDNQSCEFSNGDTVYIDDSEISGMSYDNGYVLELAWFDHESQETWDGYTVFIKQGSITPVWSYSIDYEYSDDGKNEYAYVDELIIDNSQPYVATKLYPDSCEAWKDLLVACMTFC